MRWAWPSSPKAVSSRTSTPSRAMLWAMFRPTPPRLMRTAPGLESARTSGAEDPADIHIDPAHHHGVGGGGHDIALAGDVALFHQVGYVHRHRGPGDARFVRQLLLGNQGIFLNPPKDLPFPLGHGRHS